MAVCFGVVRPEGQGPFEMGDRFEGAPGLMGNQPEIVPAGREGGVDGEYPLIQRLRLLGASALLMLDGEGEAGRGQSGAQRSGEVRLDLQGPLETGDRFLGSTGLMGDQPKIVPAGREVRLRGEKLPVQRFGFRQTSGLMMVNRKIKSDHHTPYG